MSEDKNMASRSQPGCDASGATAGVEPSAAFTPGPWVIADRELDGTTIIDHLGQLVAETWLTRHGQHVANARLIAAAPDLYEAAKAARALLVTELEEPARSVFWSLVDALAKAEAR